MDKTYVGHRDGRGIALVEVRVGDALVGSPLRHIVRHSPDGFEWGYGGSGPSDLARSMLYDHLGHMVAPGVYQHFKFGVIAQLQKEDWQITSQEIRLHLAAIRADMKISCLRCGDRGMVWKDDDPDATEDGWCQCEQGAAARKECGVDTCP